MSESNVPARPQEVVNLEHPIIRGEQKVTRVAVRKPLAGELTGLSLRDIVDMEATAMLRLLPRITEPPLLDFEVARLDPTDFLALSAEASGFFLPMAARPVSQPQ